MPSNLKLTLSCQPSSRLSSIERVQIFKDSLNRINMWGCAIVFLGVIMYKVHFHFSKMNADTVDNEGGAGESPKRQRTLQYRPIKDHFSDDEGEITDHHVDELDDFLDEHDDENITMASAIEMPTANRRVSSGQGTSSEDSDRSTSSGQARPQIQLV